MLSQQQHFLLFLFSNLLNSSLSSQSLFPYGAWFSLPTEVVVAPGLLGCNWLCAHICGRPMWNMKGLTAAPFQLLWRAQGLTLCSWHVNLAKQLLVVCGFTRVIEAAILFY